MITEEIKCNILIVDDIEANLEAIESLLIPLNQIITRAKSGKEALQAILNNEFALILMDIQMPEINGFETAELIRGRIKSRLIPIIFVTAYRLDAEYIFLGYSTGAVDYILKPINPEILLAKVKVFIELYQQNAILKKQTESLEAINKVLESEITERKKIEEKNSELTLGMKERNTELEAFSYSVSHDLRTPLRALNSFSSLLYKKYADAFDPEGKKYLDAIMTNAQRMNKLIEDLLAFSMVTRTELKKRKFNMNEIVQRAVDEIKSQETKKEEIVKINDLPNTLADDNLMYQVWINLISNAFKYSNKKATPKIEIGAYPQGDNIVYYIQDNGVGFDMAYSDKLFTVFQRLHESEDFEGTGAGLAIVKVIIDKHLGSIWAESKVNEGARFMFSLPLNNS